MAIRTEHFSLRHGLVGAWCPSLGASGLSLIDRSGRNNHGTLIDMAGQTVWVPSGGALSLQFDGANDNVSLPSTASVSTGTPFTISGWANTTNLTTSLFPCLITLTSGNQSTPFDIAISAQTTYVGVIFGSAGGWGQFRADPTWGINRWNHVALSYSGGAATSTGSFSVFVNGRAVTVTTAGAFASVANVSMIGANVSGSTFFFGGIDDVRLYSRAMTPAEIRLLASCRGIGLQPLPDRAAGLPRRFSVNVGGTWRAADSYVNVEGTWRLGQPSVNVGGTWR